MEKLTKIDIKSNCLISAYQVEGHQYRAMEFCNFETQFEVGIIS